MNAWDAEVGSANWGRDGASAGSGYPERKDETGTETEEGGSINWPPVHSEQAATQGPVSEPSAVVMPRKAAVATTAVVSGAATTRRPSMAFEIARVERAGKISSPNSARAAQVWALSRPRYIERPEQPGRRVRLLPGQEHRDSIPYGVWATSWAQMGDFGLDVGMYFVTIAQLTGATLVYAALSVVAMVHFSSSDYSGGQVDVRVDLRGSAVCTALLKVVVFESNFRETNEMLRHDCPLDAKQGFADMAGALLLFLLFFVLGKAQDKAAEYVESQVHTGQPYTVKVSSPDPLADDPDRWRRLFAQFGHVSYVTVCRGNGALLRALAERRAAGRKLEGSTSDISEIVEAYKAVDDRHRPSLGPGAWWKAIVQPLGFFRDTAYWKQRLWTMHHQAEDEVLKGMHDQGLPVEKVFITFESNLSQGRCLSHMSRGILEAPEEQHMYTNPDGFKESLRVMPASPASEVMYENLHVRLWQKLVAQIVSFALAAAVVAASYLAALRIGRSRSMLVAVLLVLVDCSLPCLIRLCSSLERHHNMIAHELSVMNKLTLARWANMVAIPLLLSDRDKTLKAENLELIANVLWLNLFVPPTFRLLDFRGRWGRSVLAPREVVQSAMDAHFRGSQWFLYERYSDMSKTVFACLMFAPVFPLAVWICVASLTLSYWTDKYLFLSAWKTPQANTNSGSTAKLARRHLALAVLAHCLASLYYYSGWPFDRICRIQGGWVECLQEGTGFVEAEPQDWMPGHQKALVNIFSVLNISWLAILLVFYYLQSIMAGFSLVLRGAPRKVRTRQHMPFSQLTSRYQHDVDAYVPQICSDDQPLPLLACDLDLLEPETIPWKLDGRKGDSFEDHCLSSSRDLPRISRYQRARLFSLCVHYPPPAPFEGIGNGRVPKTDVDWFRRPPGLQESKVPEMGLMSESRGAGEGADGNGGAIQRVERVDPPALVEGALAEVRPPPARAASRSPSRKPSRASDHLKAQHPAVHAGAVAGRDAVLRS